MYVRSRAHVVRLHGRKALSLIQSYIQRTIRLSRLPTLLAGFIKFYSFISICIFIRNPSIDIDGPQLITYAPSLPPSLRLFLTLS